MFDNFRNMMSMLGDVKQLSGKFQEMSQKMSEIKAIGEAGAGMVRVEVNGAMQMTNCTISDEVMMQNDKEFLEDLIVSATNQAIAKVKQEAMSSLPGAEYLDNFGGFKEFFGDMVPDEGDGAETTPSDDDPSPVINLPPPSNQ